MNRRQFTTKALGAAFGLGLTTLGTRVAHAQQRAGALLATASVGRRGRVEVYEGPGRNELFVMTQTGAGEVWYLMPIPQGADRFAQTLMADGQFTVSAEGNGQAAYEVELRQNGTTVTFGARGVGGESDGVVSAPPGTEPSGRFLVAVILAILVPLLAQIYFSISSYIVGRREACGNPPCYLNWPAGRQVPGPIVERPRG